MSLAELFYRKNPRLSLLSAWHRRKQRAERASRFTPLVSRFTLEALEPRLLMAAGLPGATELLAQSGDLAPASGGQSGGTFRTFFGPALNDAGQAAFYVSISDSTSDAGIFRSSGPGQVTALLRVGETAPSSGAATGGTFSNFFSPFMNNAGQAVFYGFITGSASGEGLFRSSGPGQVTALVRTGETAPSSGVGTGGTFAFFGNPAQNDAGQVAFSGIVNGSTSTGGIFSTNGPGLVSALVREDEAAPSSSIGIGGTFSFFGNPVLNDAGQTVFFATVAGSTSTQGLFLSSGPGLVTALVRTGDSAPDSGGEFGGTFVGFFDPVLNDAGQTAFLANLTGSSSGQGLFRSSSFGQVTALALAGDSAPTSGGQPDGFFEDFSFPVLNDAGQALFWANVGTSTSSEGLFLSSGPGQVTALVRAGDTAPDGNGTFNDISFGQLNLTEGGAALFFATLSGTAGGDADDGGLFLADGQEIVQIAREGQSVAGSTITGIGFSNQAITDGGQIAFNFELENGQEAIGLFTPDLHWRATTSGDWDTNSNWAASLTPAAIHNIAIDPLAGVTVTGPAQATTIDSLTIGAKASGTATLQLNGGGDLSVTNGVAIHTRGALDQQLGTVTAGPVTNAGSMTQASGSTMNLTALFNTGSVLFNGQTTVEATLQNRGSLSVGSGGTLTASGTPHNFGLFFLDNGVFNGGTEGFRNEAGGHLSGRGTINADFVNDGTVDTTGVLTLAQGLNFGRMSIGLGETLVLQGPLQSTGLIDLTDGAITGAGPLTNFLGGSIRGSGSVIAPVTNQGLIHATGNGVLSIDLSGANRVSGELQVDDGSTLNVTTAFTTAGTTVLKGASAMLNGGGIMLNTGTVRGQGRITAPVANSGVIRAEGGTLTLSATSNSNLVTGRIEAGTGTAVLYQQGLATNAALIALTGGRFDNSFVALNNTGRIEGRGIFASGELTNATGGLIHFADGPADIFGPVLNTATLNVTNSTSTFFNAVTNSATGTIKNTGGVTRFLGGFTNSGVFISDPADNHFTDLTISDTGYLVGGLGDRFIVTDDLLNSSTRSADWNTSAAELIFQNGTDVHDFLIAGADHDGAVGGFSDNFSWGTVRLAVGQTLRLQDGNGTQGGALYVKNLVLEGGLSQINSITGNGLNIYYDSLAPANAYLGEQTYSLQNGGLLAPMRSLDFDANGLADALTDGILAVRHLFGFTGDPLTTGVVDPAGLRTASSALGNYLGQAQGSLLDVDGNGVADALSDGIVIIRYLFGFTGDALITGVVDPAGTRTTASVIEAFLAGFLPGSTSAASTQVSTAAAGPSSVVDNDPDAPTTDLSLAYVQRSWVQHYVADGVRLADAFEEEELLIALPG